MKPDTSIPATIFLIAFCGPFALFALLVVVKGIRHWRQREQ